MTRGSGGLGQHVAVGTDVTGVGILSGLLTDLCCSLPAPSRRLHQTRFNSTSEMSTHSTPLKKPAVSELLVTAER